jgi:DNA ligase 1
MDILHTLNLLGEHPTKKGKLRVLFSKQDNPVLQEVFRLITDPTVTFGIKKKLPFRPSKLPMVYEDPLVWDCIFELLGKLSKRELTGNAALEEVQRVLESVPYAIALAAERVLLKDARCGVGPALLKEVWPDLVPTTPCMRASSYSDKAIQAFPFPAYAQRKADGMRCMAIVEGGKVCFKTRGGQTLKGLTLLEESVLVLANKRASGLVLDGELTIEGLPRKASNGILLKAQTGTLSEEESAYITYTIWDHMAIVGYHKGSLLTSYEARLAKLTLLNWSDDRSVRLIETRTVANIGEALEYYQQMLAIGEEGIVLKDIHSPWVDKRSPHHLKLKEELEGEFVVTGVVEGSGKLAGTTGALLVETYDGLVKTSVGAGLDDATRHDFWSTPPINRVVTVKYNGLSTDKKGDYSLLHPVYHGLRLDKNEADSLPTLQLKTVFTKLNNPAQNDNKTP